MRIQVRLTRTGGAFSGAGKQELFALANAMNRTMEEDQVRQRAGIAQRMTVRAPGFINRLVKINPGDRARKDRLVSRIRIEGPEGNPGAANVLTRQESPATHSKPGGPLSSFFVPADATRPTPSTVIARALFPKALRLMDRMAPSGMLYAKRHVTQSGVVQIKGKRRTFVLVERGTGSGGDGRALGVYQREGPGRNDIQLLWLYTPRVRIKTNRLQFAETFRRTVYERLELNYRGMLVAAYRTAR